MLRRRIFPVIVLLSFFILFSPSLEILAFDCVLDDTSKASLCTYDSRPPIDTIHTLAIYCCGAETLYSLPMYYSSVWQLGEFSVSQFFEDNSDGKYALSCDAVKDGFYPIQHPTLDPSEEDCAGGGTEFASVILEIVDSLVDFADYDGDEDGVVDGFFFVIVGDYETPKGCACLSNFSYQTDDTTLTGDTIEVSGEMGVEVRIKAPPEPTPEAEFVHICVHQWGHQFGLIDLHGG